MIYVISDTHFGHQNLIDYGVKEENSDEEMWKGFDTLPDDCILIHCGDITIGMDEMFHIRFAKYKFKKWLIKGNHDNHSISWYLTNGWDCVVDELMIKMYGENILFTHIPYSKRHGISRNIHGHLHNNKSRGLPDFYDKDYHKEVTTNVIGFTPLKLKEVI